MTLSGVNTLSFKGDALRSSLKKTQERTKCFLLEILGDTGVSSRSLLIGGTYHMFLSGCRSVLMRFTIQLKSLPYRALDMASLTSEALSTVLARMMVSPRVTTQCEVRASWSSSGLMQRTEAARREGEDSAGEFGHPSICPNSQPTS